MPYEFKDVDLPGYSLDVCNLRYFVFIKNFNGYILISMFMGCGLNFAEGPFTDRLS